MQNSSVNKQDVENYDMVRWNPGLHHRQLPSVLSNWIICPLVAVATMIKTFTSTLRFAHFSRSFVSIQHSFLAAHYDSSNILFWMRFKLKIDVCVWLEQRNPVNTVSQYHIGTIFCNSRQLLLPSGFLSKLGRLFQLSDLFFGPQFSISADLTTKLVLLCVHPWLLVGC